MPPAGLSFFDIYTADPGASLADSLLRAETAGRSRLRTIRAYREMSPLELAIRAGMGLADIVAFEEGVVTPTPDQAAKLAAVLDVEPKLLAGQPATGVESVGKLS